MSLGLRDGHRREGSGPAPRFPGFGFRRQIIVLAAVISVLAALVLIGTVQLILSGLSTRSADQALANRSNDLAASVRAASPGKALHVPAGVLDVGVAVYDANGALLAGRPPEHLAGTYERLRADAPVTVADHEQSYRVMARTIRTRGGTTARAVLAERLEPYEQTERYALFLTLAAGIVLVAGATAVAAWATHRVLQPVEQMARTAEDWSEHDLSRRFGLTGPGNEITALGDTLDGLLEKVARAILAEQRLTGELAHELRTPLAVIQGNAELLAGTADLGPDAREDVEEIVTACRRMADTISSLLNLARTGASTGDQVVTLAEVVNEAVEQLPAEARARVDVEASPPDARTSMPVTLAVRTLFPVLSNASRFGGRVRVHASGTPLHWSVHVDDDGPGLAEESVEQAFTPGFSTSASAGLGLPLARRIARSAGGDVILAQSAAGATRFTVDLPRARSTAGPSPRAVGQRLPSSSGGR